MLYSWECTISKLAGLTRYWEPTAIFDHPRSSVVYNFRHVLLSFCRVKVKVTAERLKILIPTM